MSGKLLVHVESFTPRRSNTLIGFVDILVPQMRLRVKEASIHQSHDRRWVGLPAKPQIDQDGRVRLDDRGKRLYTPVLQFTDKMTATAFGDRVIAALLQTYPDAFNEAEESAEAG